jgi:hypothetical protein
MKILGTFSLLLIASCSAALGRIGETAIQFVDRYGTPKDTPSSKIYDKNSPVLEGAVHHTYEYQVGEFARRFFKSMDQRFGWIFRNSVLIYRSKTTS